MRRCEGSLDYHFISNEIINDKVFISAHRSHTAKEELYKIDLYSFPRLSPKKCANFKLQGLILWNSSTQIVVNFKPFYIHVCPDFVLLSIQYRGGVIMAGY